MELCILSTESAEFKVEINSTTNEFNLILKTGTFPILTINGLIFNVDLNANILSIYTENESYIRNYELEQGKALDDGITTKCRPLISLNGLYLKELENKYKIG